MLVDPNLVDEVPFDPNFVLAVRVGRIIGVPLTPVIVYQIMLATESACAASVSVAGVSVFEPSVSVTGHV